MVRFICYSNSKKLYIVGNQDCLGNWNKPIKMTRKKGYFEFDDTLSMNYHSHSPVLEFKFKNSDGWETIFNRKYIYKNSNDYGTIICKWNIKKFKYRESPHRQFFKKTFEPVGSDELADVLSYQYKLLNYDDPFTLLYFCEKLKFKIKVLEKKITSDCTIYNEN